MSDQLRIGFIGAGRIADLHALAYRDNPEASIYAVCDADSALAARRGQEWGAAKTFADAAELLADPNVDGVEILTPHHLHASQAIAALRAGKHVSLQKPMARTLDEAEAIVRAAQDTDRVFRVLENYRYYPPFLRAKELLDSGEIGEPITIRMKVIAGDPRYGWEVPLRSWAWRLDQELSGGGPEMFDHGYHMFSLARWFLGEPEEVFGWIQRTEVALGVAIDSPAALIWRYRQGGRLGTWETVTSTGLQVRSRYYSNDEWLEITGTRGLIWVNRCTGDMLQRPPVVVYRDGHTTEYHDIDSDWAASFVLAVGDWHRAMRQGGQPELSAEEGREVLRFALAAHRAAREGRPVRLDEIA